MTESQLAFILRYSVPKEMFIINQESSLVKLVCPFIVLARDDVGELIKGKYYEVDSVLVDKCIITVFKILNKHFYYYHFTICD